MTDFMPDFVHASNVRRFLRILFRDCDPARECSFAA